MSSAFVRESDGVPQVFASREAAESAAALHTRLKPGVTYEVRARSRGGYMVARLDAAGEFESWLSE